MAIQQISTYRTQLMGLAMLAIMLFHSEVDLEILPQWLRTIPESAYIGVEIFFFFSGFGLAFSWHKDSNLKRFYKKRLLRILPAFVIVSSLFALKNHLVGVTMLSPFWATLTGLDFYIFNDLKSWFIPAILTCYLFFPLYYRSLAKIGNGRALLWWSAGAISLSILLALSPVPHLQIFTIRIPLFLMGISLGYQLTQKKNMPSLLTSLPLNALLVVIVYSGIGILFQHTTIESRWATGLWWYPTIVLTWPLLIVCAALFAAVGTPQSKRLSLFTLLGSHSLEIYLFHETLCHLFAYTLKLSDKPWNLYRIPEYLLYAGITLIMAVILQKTLRFLFSLKDKARATSRP